MSQVSCSVRVKRGRLLEHIVMDMLAKAHTAKRLWLAFLNVLVSISKCLGQHI